MGKSDYFRFSMRDSLALEASFLQVIISSYKIGLCCLRKITWSWLIVCWHVFFLMIIFCCEPKLYLHIMCISSLLLVFFGRSFSLHSYMLLVGHLYVFSPNMDPYLPIRDSKKCGTRRKEAWILSNNISECAKHILLRCHTSSESCFENFSSSNM